MMRSIIMIIMFFLFENPFKIFMLPSGMIQLMCVVCVGCICKYRLVYCIHCFFHFTSEYDTYYIEFQSSEFMARVTSTQICLMTRDDDDAEQIIVRQVLGCDEM